MSPFLVFGIEFLNLQDSWFLTLQFFCVGSSCSSTWLRSLPFQMLRTYNNQDPRPFETLLSLQRFPEGILLSCLLLCPSESANAQNHCRIYAIWHGFFCRAYAIWHGFFLRTCVCWHGCRLAWLMPFGMG